MMMLDLQVSVQGDKVLIEGLTTFAAELPAAVGRGFTKVGMGVHRAAFDWLSGPGRTTMRLSNRGAMINENGSITNRRSQRKGQSNSLGARPGSYPVPVLTGNLRRLLDWVKPRESKSSGGHSFSAGPMEVIVYDSAEYASVIHEGTGSSSKSGPRKFLDDALAKFNQGSGIANVVEAEIKAEVSKRGL